MNPSLQILHFEDDPRDALLIRKILQREGLCNETIVVESGKEFVAAIESREIELILSDYTIPGFDGMEALDHARKRKPETPFIFVSGTIDEGLAVESLKQGATDYVFKNGLSRLGPAVRRAIRDVAERAESCRAEEAMRESEHKYRQLFETLADAAFLADVETGKILDTNKQGEALLGRQRADILGRKQELFQSRAVVDQRRRFEADPARAGCADYEDEVVRPDGARVPVSIRVAPLILYGRKLMLGVYRDMSRHKLAEEQFQEQARLLDLEPDAILVRALDGQVRYSNESATRLYGWTREEMTGANAGRALADGDGETEVARKAVLEEGSWSGELRQFTKEGREIKVFSRWTLVRDNQGRPKSILLVNTLLAPREQSRFGRLARPAGRN